MFIGIFKAPEALPVAEGGRNHFQVFWMDARTGRPFFRSLTAHHSEAHEGGLKLPRRFVLGDWPTSCATKEVLKHRNFIKTVDAYHCLRIYDSFTTEDFREDCHYRGAN